MSFSSHISRTHKNILEARSGKIQSESSTWVYGTPPKEVLEKLQGKNKGLARDADNTLWRKSPRTGRYERSAKKRGCICPNLEMWQDSGKVPYYGYYGDAENPEKYWVFASECRKSQFYQAKKDSPEKYPICTFSRAENPSRAAAEEMRAAWEETFKTVNEIMG